MSADRDAAFTEYVAARLPWLRRLAMLLCQDWQRADDLVQSAITKLSVHWNRAAAADHLDAYARAVLVREFIYERRSSWARRVWLGAELPDSAAAAPDLDVAMDIKQAVTALPARQQAALVLRFYCDLSVQQTAQVLECSPGTVKSQTAKALRSLRLALASSAVDELGRTAEPQGRQHGEVT